jgi:hypothetical protein
MQAFIDGCLKQKKDCSGGELGESNGDGVDYVLGNASRAADPVYPALPFPDPLAGMPASMSPTASASALPALPARAWCKAKPVTTVTARAQPPASAS